MGMTTEIKPRGVASAMHPDRKLEKVPEDEEYTADGDSNNGSSSKTAKPIKPSNGDSPVSIVMSEPPPPMERQLPLQSLRYFRTVEKLAQYHVVQIFATIFVIVYDIIIDVCPILGKGIHMYCQAVDICMEISCIFGLLLVDAFVAKAIEIMEYCVFTLPKYIADTVSLDDDVDQRTGCCTSTCCTMLRPGIRCCRHVQEENECANQKRCQCQARKQRIRASLSIGEVTTEHLGGD